MVGLLNLALSIAILAWIVGYVVTVIKILAEGDQIPALVSALGFFVCGIGAIFALGWGWYRAAKYRSFLPWMIFRSVAWAILVVGGIAKAILDS